MMVSFSLYEGSSGRLRNSRVSRHTRRGATTTLEPQEENLEADDNFRIPVENISHLVNVKGQDSFAENPGYQVSYMDQDSRKSTKSHDQRIYAMDYESDALNYAAFPCANFESYKKL